MEWWVVLVIAFILLIFLTILMVSTIHYDWPRLVFKGKWNHVAQSVGIFVIVGMMAVFPHWSLLPAFLFYILIGVFHWILELLRGEVSLTNFFLTVNRN